MSEPTSELAKTTDTPEAAAFALIQRKATLYASSSLVPAQYRALKEIKEYGNVVGTEKNPNAVANCVIALDIAKRMGANELMVMQNLYIVEGRPAWSSQWVIAAVNNCGKFSPLRFELTDLGTKEVEYTVVEWVDKKKQNRKVKATISNIQCVAWAIEKATGDRLDGPPVSMEMAVQEGWYGKNGSKWQTMPQMMLRYRAASFFGRLYAPELLMGIMTDDEVVEIPAERVVTGREVPTAKVPDFLAAPAKVEELEPEPKQSAVCEFWDRCNDNKMDRDTVMEILREQKITEDEHPEDLAEFDAESALAVFSKLKGAYDTKGGADIYDDFESAAKSAQAAIAKAKGGAQ